MKKILFLVIALLYVAGSQVVAQDTIGTTKLWSGNPDNFDDAIFSHDGRFLYAGGRSKTPIIKYNALTGEILDTLNSGFSGRNFCMNMLPGDSILVFLKAISFYNGSCTVPVFYNLNTNSDIIYDSTHLDRRIINRGIKFNKSYTKYAVLGESPDSERSIRIYNAATHQQIKEFGYRYGIALDFVGWTSDSTILCSNWLGGNIYVGELYNVNTGSFQASTDNLLHPVTFDDISPDGKTFLEINILYSTDSLKPIKILKNTTGLYGGLFDKTGNYIFFDSEDQNPKVYDLRQEKIICNSMARSGPINFMNDSNNLIFSYFEVYKVNWDFITDVPEGTIFKLIKTYPNPTTSFLYIDSEAEIKNVELYDILGIRQNIEINNNTIKLLENMPKGIYFVKYDSNNLTYFDKVVIE